MAAIAPLTELDRAMTQSLLSASLLHQDIMDGSEGKMKGIHPRSLPTRIKAHIFEGLDTSFIEDEILKVTCDRDKCLQLEGSEKPSSACPPLPSCGGALSPPDLDHKKYRLFLKELELRTSLAQLRRFPPPLKESTEEQPTSYNAFMAGPGPVTPAGPADPLVSGVLAEVWPVQACPQLQDVKLHVQRVRELLGKRELRERRKGGQKGPVSRRREITAGWDSELFSR